MSSNKDIEQLEAWWENTNGTGTAACPKCYRIQGHICTWHRARLDELAEKLTTARTEAKREAVDDTNYALKRILFENLPAEENYDWFEKEFDSKVASLKRENQ